MAAISSSNLAPCSRWSNSITRAIFVPKLQRLDEDLGALSVAFTSKDLREIDEAASKIEVQGARLPPAVLAMSGR